MIFYFTGTGNSRAVATQWAKLNPSTLLSMSDALRQAPQGELCYTLERGEAATFVFPVHAWGPALLVQRFVERLRLRTPDDALPQVTAICICGDDCGYTAEILAGWLSKRGIKLSACYSVAMPNNYILLPGFDVDTTSVEQSKIREMPQRLQQIFEQQTHPSAMVSPTLYVRGTMAWLKSYVIRPLFLRYAFSPEQFRTTDACTACGACAHHCPTGTICMVDDKPVWKHTDDCVQCLRCLHQCPQRAIEYASATLHKGRYHYK